MDKINKITTSGSRIPVLVKKKGNQQDNKPTYFSTPTKHPSTLKITTSDSRTPVLAKKNGNQQDNNKPTYFSTPTKHINSSGYDSGYDSSSSTCSTPTTPSMLSRASSNNSVFSKSMDTLNSISGAKIEELRKRVYSITDKDILEYKQKAEPNLNKNACIKELKGLSDLIFDVLTNKTLSYNYNEKEKTELEYILTTIGEEYFSGKNANQPEYIYTGYAKFLINEVERILDKKKTSTPDLSQADSHSSSTGSSKVKKRVSHISRRNAPVSTVKKPSVNPNGNNPRVTTGALAPTVKKSLPSYASGNISRSNNITAPTVKKTSTNINSKNSLKSSRAPSYNAPTLNEQILDKQEIDKFMQIIKPLQEKNDALVDNIIKNLSGLQKTKFPEMGKEFDTIKRQIRTISDDTKGFYQQKYNLYEHGKGRVNVNDLLSRLRKSEDRLKNMESSIIHCLVNYRFFGNLESVRKKFGFSQ
ncbi:MAG: hypothetical protein LW807_05360 [Proteobacteria bacterium]|nr:hypothetical protein [Pseudomonadota bacterium]